MTRHAVLFISLMLGFSRDAGAGRVLLVADKAQDRVQFLDTATLAVVGTASTGRHPHELAASPDGRTAFAANYGAGDSVSVIDVRSRRRGPQDPAGPIPRSARSGGQSATAGGST